MTALIAAQAAAIVLLGLLVAGLLRSHAEILRKLHELGVHLDGRPDHAPGATHAPDLAYAAGVTPARETSAPARDIAGVSPEGDAVGIAVGAGNRPTLLAFLSSGCATCAGYWEAFARPGGGAIGDTRLVVVTKGPDEESPARLAKLAPSDAPLVMTSEAWLDYEVPGSPYFVLVDAAGHVAGEGSATSWDQLETLIGEATADTRARSAHKWHADAAREDDADRELMAAGIHPGHPSLYPEPEAATNGDKR